MGGVTFQFKVGRVMFRVGGGVSITKLYSIKGDTNTPKYRLCKWINGAIVGRAESDNTVVEVRREGEVKVKVKVSINTPVRVSIL